MSAGLVLGMLVIPHPPTESPIAIRASREMAQVLLECVRVAPPFHSRWADGDPRRRRSYKRPRRRITRYRQYIGRHANPFRFEERKARIRAINLTTNTLRAGHTDTSKAQFCWRGGIRFWYPKGGTRETMADVNATTRPNATIHL